ncbi:MAG: FadR family transcriptional regulator [Solirubrobacteraceae bacterium]|nr:FadR family transcriptional regulator [Solirubrobacteraceae bacterium]
MNIEGSIARTTVSDAVYRRLRDQILGSGAEPGAPLPSERTLSETFGVNRHAVREAIKRLQQAGLVTVVHGGATRVTDWRREGGPELLVAVASGLESGDRTKLAQQIVDARAAIAMLLVEGAAAKGDFNAGAADDVTGSTDEAAVAAYRDLWRDIAAASGNLAAQLTLNSLNAGLDALETEGLAVYEAEASRTDAITSLASAIASGDATAAQSAAADVFSTQAVRV